MGWLAGEGVYGTRHGHDGSVPRLERLENPWQHCREGHQICHSRQLPLQLGILKLLTMQHHAW